MALMIGKPLTASIASSTPLVSIIVPNYNHARYLHRRLESVFNQTLRDIEIILLDDASTDGSIEILRKYAAEPLVKHLLVNEVNGGSTFRQWAKGLGLANGVFVWIAESDDYCEMNFLEQLIRILQTTGAALAFTQPVPVNEADLQTAPYTPMDSEYMVHAGVGKMLTSNPFINASSLVFRRDAVSPDVLKELQKYRFTGDWLLWLSICARLAVCWVRGPLAYYRRHSGSVSVGAEKTGLRYIEGFMALQFITVNYNIVMTSQDAEYWAHDLVNSIAGFDKRQAFAILFKALKAAPGPIRIRTIGLLPFWTVGWLMRKTAKLVTLVRQR